MKKVIISFVWAVGMRHWGPRELEVGSVLYGKHEYQNPKDPNAIVLCAEKNFARTMAYLRRSDAVVISQLFKAKVIVGHCYFKVKTKVEKFGHKTGPQQKLNVGFLCQEENIEKMTDILKDSNLHVRIF